MSAVKFIGILSFYFAFALNTSFWQQLFAKISIGNFAMAWFVVSLPFFVFVPLLWFLCLITLPKIAKPLIIFLLLASAAADYAMRKLGVVIDSDMVRNFAETNLREAADLITWRAFFHVVIWGGIPSVWVFFCRIHYNRFGREFIRRLAICGIGLSFILLVAATSYKEYVSFGRNNREIRHYINTFNYIYAVGRYWQKTAEANRTFTILDDRPQRLTMVPENQPRLLVLLVGETARAANFSLYGYERQTNPLLEKQDIITLKNVFSCGTATAVSLPCMFAAAGRSDFNAGDVKYTQNLLDLAQTAGYQVYWKDNDDGCKGVCARVSNVDAKDEKHPAYCFGDYCHDDVLLTDLEEHLKNARGKDTVLVLHMMGSHGPTYYKRYPDAFKKFSPACDTADLQNCSREQIINTYDNTILYSDYIISSVIDALKKHPKLNSSMIYISDHGESLGENNIYLHGLPYAIAPEEQKKVPMILWMSDQLRQNMKLNEKCLRQKAETTEFSHDNLFHSVLRLLAVKTPLYTKNLDIFNDCMP